MCPGPARMLHRLGCGDVDLRKRGRAGRRQPRAVFARVPGSPRPQSSSEARRRPALALRIATLIPIPSSATGFVIDEFGKCWPSMSDGPISAGPGGSVAHDAAIRPATLNPSGSGDGGSARLKSDAGRLQMDEFGVGGAIQEFDGLRQPQHRRGRKQHGIGHRHDGADRAGIVRVLPVGIAVGSGLPSRTGSVLPVRQDAVPWDALDCIAGAACAAIPWKWPNASTNWIASAKSASREPCLMFDRNHFMPTGTPHRRRPGDPGPRRCYNITSGNLRGCQPSSRPASVENCRGCVVRATPAACQRDQRPSRSQVAAKAPSSSSRPIRPANSGSTPTPLTTLASRILTPIQPSP